MEKDNGPSAPQEDPLHAALLSVWRQVMVDNQDQVQLEGGAYPVHRTGHKRLRQVRFSVAGRDFLGVEQNPRTTSRWAQMARRGARIMQFIEDDRYVANVADGKLLFY